MRQFVRIIDEKGFFVEDAFVEKLNERTITAICPPGFHLPKWNGESWVEGKIATEIKAEQGNVHISEERQRLNALETLILEMEGII